MKAVHLVVELSDSTLFIEIKDFHAPDDYNFKAAVNDAEQGKRRERMNHLRDVLVHKFRDTWLYRWASSTCRPSLAARAGNRLCRTQPSTLEQYLPRLAASPRPNCGHTYTTHWCALRAHQALL